jgi:hypothetical protein
MGKVVKLKLHSTYGVVGKPASPLAEAVLKGFQFARKEDLDNSWLCGFGLALAEVNRGFDQPTIVAEVARAAGLVGKKGLAELKAAGLDEYDLKELRKCLR